jgi:hypothetical protein
MTEVGDQTLPVGRHQGSRFLLEAAILRHRLRRFW